MSGGSVTSCFMTGRVVGCEGDDSGGCVGPVEEEEEGAVGVSGLVGTCDVLGT